MSRVPIRARLAIAFSAALLIVLALAAVFVIDRVRSDLLESGDEALSARLDSLRTLADDLRTSGSGYTLRFDFEDNFTQVLGPGGEVLLSTLPESSGTALDATQLATVGEGGSLFEEVDVEGVDGSARVLAAVDGEGRILIAGTSNQDREETLAQIAAAFAIGSPVAVLLAALLGYWLAGRAMGPVERIRSGAAAIEPGSGDRLPVPDAKDELRRLATTLNDMLGRQDEALTREREFVANASHELRTPLAVLRAELEVAELEERSPAELERTLTSAVAEVDRLARLADDLLVIAMSEGGQVPIRRERVDLRDLLDRVRRRFPGGREIAVNVAGDGEALVDPLRVEQAVANLIDNSLRHGAGTVTVTASTADDALEVSVADEGSGFGNVAEAEAAFGRFHRGSGGESEGAGLGLAIVRAIAAAHGGEARVSRTSPPRVTVTFAAE